MIEVLPSVRTTSARPTSVWRKGTPPITACAPGRSSTVPEIRWPLTHVPFVEPRSVSIEPRSVRLTWAWRRETSRPSISTSADGSRPTVSVPPISRARNAGDRRMPERSWASSSGARRISAASGRLTHERCSICTAGSAPEASSASGPCSRCGASSRFIDTAKTVGSAEAAGISAEWMSSSDGPD